MKASLILALSVLLALPAHAESGVGDCATARDPGPVSYTHLTLPTNREV